METSKLKKLAILSIFTIFLILYFFLISLDLFPRPFFISSDYINYFCILLCFLLSLLIGKDSLGPKDLRLLQLGLFLTCLADLCLIIFNYFTLGITLFCLVQITYSIRYKVQYSLLMLKYFTLIFSCIFTIYLFICFTIIKLDILFVFALFYAICIITSVICAIKNKYQSPNKYMVAFGMILFLLCDINVALRNITSLISLPETFTAATYELSTVLIFVFYLPSQLLLALSGTNWTQYLKKTEK
jgi:hypothetical protein